jgi:hypothetical protein
MNPPVESRMNCCDRTLSAIFVALQAFGFLLWLVHHCHPRWHRLVRPAVVQGATLAAFGVLTLMAAWLDLGCSITCGGFSTTLLLVLLRTVSQPTVDPYASLYP